MLLRNEDIAKPKRQLKHGPALGRAERVEYLQQLIQEMRGKLMSETSRNKSVITGLLYRVQPRKTKTGTFVCAFTVAVVDAKAKQYISVVGWKGLGERVAAMALGSKVYVSGRLQSGSWTDASGNKRYKTEIIADTVEEVASLQSRPNPEAAAARLISDEDIPF
jgi:single-stranded DNA-binding protein